MSYPFLRHRIRLATLLLTATGLLAFQPLAPALENKDAAKKNTAPTPTTSPAVFRAPDANIAEGYALIAPMNDRRTYLVDRSGEVVHAWDSEYLPGRSAYLLEDGSLLRAARTRPETAFRRAGGLGGRLQKISWDGEILWDFWYSNDESVGHHDIEPLPNGNVLMLTWETVSAETGKKLGRDPKKMHENGLWNEVIMELKPKGTEGAEPVWRWSALDHIVQDFDKNAPDYGVVSEHPELIDLNHVIREDEDWIHFNSIDFNPELNQILLSAHAFSELWVIDRSTTTEEAKAAAGGKRGRGGDLLYRWGNPRTYGRGSKKDQKLFRQHDAQWIAKGLPGAGNILVFNNGWLRPLIEYSTVEEITAPVNSDGSYQRPKGKENAAAFGPKAPLWHYEAPDKLQFYSQRISGVQRLANGNTLICSGSSGTLFEVQKDSTQVWQFRSPFGPRRGSPVPPATGDPKGSRPSPASGTNSSSQQAAAPFGRNSVFKSPWYPADFPAFKGRLSAKAK